MGSVFDELGPPVTDPDEAVRFPVVKLTVFSVFILCLGEEDPPPPDPAKLGVAGGIVAAVHVSVTGQSSDLILVTFPPIWIF